MQETSPGPMAGKAEWRPWFRKILAGLGDSENQSQQICDHFATFLKSRPACRIATFAALPGEPCVLPLIEPFPQHHWALPRVLGDDLVYHEVSAHQSHQPGAFGITEPSPGLPLISTETIDIFLCPGMGFTPAGTRLGRGKGFYDRALSSSKSDALFFGVAFREQIVAHLPTDPHDVTMTHLLGPDGISDS